MLMKACAILNCKIKYHAKGFCQKHYLLHKRGLQPLNEIDEQTKKRFWDKVAPKDVNGCMAHIN